MNRWWTNRCTQPQASLRGTTGSVAYSCHELCKRQRHCKVENVFMSSSGFRIGLIDALSRSVSFAYLTVVEKANESLLSYTFLDSPAPIPISGNAFTAHPTLRLCAPPNLHSPNPPVPFPTFEPSIKPCSQTNLLSVQHRQSPKHDVHNEPFPAAASPTNLKSPNAIQAQPTKRRSQ